MVTSRTPESTLTTSSRRCERDRPVNGAIVTKLRGSLHTGRQHAFSTPASIPRHNKSEPPHLFLIVSAASYLLKTGGVPTPFTVHAHNDPARIPHLLFVLYSMLCLYHLSLYSHFYFMLLTYPCPRDNELYSSMFGAFASVSLRNASFLTHRGLGRRRRTLDPQGCKVILFSPS